MPVHKVTLSCECHGPAVTVTSGPNHRVFNLKPNYCNMRLQVPLSAEEIFCFIQLASSKPRFYIKGVVQVGTGSGALHFATLAPLPISSFHQPRCHRWMMASMP